MNLDKHLLQLKNGTRQMADRFIALFNSTACSGIRLKLVNLCAQFWCSPNFNRIASTMQLRYVSFLLYTMIVKAGPAAVFQDQALFECVRHGIQERLSKISGANTDEQYQHGLLLWKVYIESLGIEKAKEFEEEQDDDEKLELGQITPEIVFANFTA